MFKKIKTAIILIILTAIFTACSNSIQANTPIPPDKIIENNPSDVKSGKPELSDEEKAKIELEKKLAEREELEKQHKEAQGEFYVSLVPVGSEREKKKEIIKALYATGYTAGNAVSYTHLDVYKRQL